eukprot:jgi/Tetstr1/449128/TSEL_036338.t1
MELIGLPSKEVKVQSGKGKAITKADLPALSGANLKKIQEGRKLVLDTIIHASYAYIVKILAVWEKYDGMLAAWSADHGGLATRMLLAATNKLRTATDRLFAACMDITTAKDITPYIHEAAWHFPSWMKLHGNLDDALRATCTEHNNKETKEGKVINHQPLRLLKSGKVTLSVTGQVLKRSTLMAHHRDMHGPSHCAHPLLLKVKADAVKA